MHLDELENSVLNLGLGSIPSVGLGLYRHLSAVNLFLWKFYINSNVYEKDLQELFNYLDGSAKVQLNRANNFIQILRKTDLWKTK